MSILIGAAIGAALPWLFTLIWAFIYWNFSLLREMAGYDTRCSVVCAILFALVAAFEYAANGGAA